jgi:hypothetical protein
MRQGKEHGEKDLLVTPFCRVNFVSLDGAMVRINACELDVLAKIVPAVHTEKAFATWDTGLYGYSVICLRSVIGRWKFKTYIPAFLEVCYAFTAP